MKPSKLRRYVHTKNPSAVLFVGYDETGRLVSRLEKDGKIVATDIYVKMPNPIDLDNQGWTREQ